MILFSVFYKDLAHVGILYHSQTGLIGSSAQDEGGC